MAEVITAEHAGFCFGVERAVAQAYGALKEGGTICTYGEIIHNEAVVQDLADKGVRVLGGVDELDTLTGGSVVIRSHGVDKAVYDKIGEKGLRCIDATCPFVTRIHEIVRQAGEKGQTVVVVGNRTHPEVQGIVGWAAGPVYVIADAVEARDFSPEIGGEITVVSQTTGNRHKFEETVEILKQKGYNINIVNTICNATSVRQEEAEKIAAAVDVMFVVGGAQSSNTRKLYEICKGKCAGTYLIQNAGDIDSSLIAGASRIGITAGASTPKKIIEEVQTYVRTGPDV